MAGVDPHIVHVHEWQTAALPMLYWEAYHGSSLTRARMVLTIHCLDNSGECREDEFGVSGGPNYTVAACMHASYGIQIVQAELVLLMCKLLQHMLWLHGRPACCTSDKVVVAQILLTGFLSVFLLVAKSWLY